MHRRLKLTSVWSQRPLARCLLGGETLLGTWLAQPRLCQQLALPSGSRGHSNRRDTLGSHGAWSPKSEGAGGHARTSLRADRPETAQPAPCCLGPAASCSTSSDRHPHPSVYSWPTIGPWASPSHHKSLFLKSMAAGEV